MGHCVSSILLKSTHTADTMHSKFSLCLVDEHAIALQIEKQRPVKPITSLIQVPSADSVVSGCKEHFFDFFYWVTAIIVSSPSSRF